MNKCARDNSWNHKKYKTQISKTLGLRQFLKFKPGFGNIPWNIFGGKNNNRANYSLLLQILQSFFYLNLFGFMMDSKYVWLCIQYTYITTYHD